MFTESQTRELLIGFLAGLERRAQEEPGSRADARLRSFLTAQGYSVGRQAPRASLKDSVRGLRAGQDTIDSAVPETVRRVVLASGDACLEMLFGGGLAGVSHVKSLFG